MKDFFSKNGYVVMKNLISKKTIETVRKEASLLFEKYKDFTLTPTQFLNLPSASDSIVSDKAVDYIKSIVGKSYCMQPNYTIRKDLYIGWHCDDEFSKGNLFEDCLTDMPEFLQCNIYLQDNHTIFGGGIDVYAKSHHLFHQQKKAIIDKNTNNYISIKTKAGDMLIFDYRIVHRSSQPKVSSPLDRLAIQWTISLSENFSKKYLYYLLNRRSDKLHLSDFTGKRALQYFNDIPNISYPDSFSNYFKIQVKKHNIGILTAKKYQLV